MLSVIVPAYKQEKTIVKDLHRIENTLKQIRYDYEIICVVDGSLDRTYEKARQVSSAKVKIFSYEENHGKGYGSEALNLLIDYAFNNLNLHKVTLKVVDYNKQAIKLYEKKGFVKEGILKENILQNNEYLDVSIYSIFNKNR